MTQENSPASIGKMSRRGLIAAAATAGSVAGASVTGLAIASCPDATLGTGKSLPPADDGADYVLKNDLVINVKDYGVKGDGRTDDTGAINALLAQIGRQGLQRIFFPTGRYMHTGISVNQKSGFELTGPGELVATASTVSEYVSLDGCTDFKLLGLRSRHEDPTVRRTTPARTFSLTNCHEFEVAGCHAHHGEGVGIMLNHCSRAVLHGNRVHDTKADGIGLYGDTHHVTVTGNTTYETGDDGIAQVGVMPQGVRPYNNAISGNTVARAHARGIAVVGAYNTTITGNTVETTRAGGIYVASESSQSTYGCANVVISGNVITNANVHDPMIDQAAIFVFGEAQPVEDVTVANNRIFSARSEGIRVGGSSANTRRITLIGNGVTKAGASGLALWSVEDVSVIGNVLTDLGGGGISTGEELNGAVLVSNNTVRNPNTSGSTFAAIGMKAGSGASVVVSANTIVSARSSTYGIDAPAHATIFGNAIDGAQVRGGAEGSTEFYGNLCVSAGAAADAAGGKGAVAIRNATNVPTATPAHGGVLYVEDGMLKYKGSKGTVTTLGPP